jgi:DNA-3-methyladenine glycosylase
VSVPLDRSFYLRPARIVARELLGCVLVSRLGTATTAGRIVETEAYLGPEDAASHAAFRPSSRPLFYGAGGIAYVFRAYGVHLCLNAITGRAGRPGCVLIRALEPVTGLPTMARRRRIGTRRALATGPGNVTRALGITLADNGTDLTRGRLTIEPRAPHDRFRVVRGPRVGITRDVDRPLRFWVAGSACVSGPRGSARPTGNGKCNDGTGVARNRAAAISTRARFS